MAIIAFGEGPAEGMSTATKYALGAAALVAVGAVAWAMMKKPAALKANKRRRTHSRKRKCPACAATPKKSSTRCHRCGHSYGMRANAAGKYYVTTFCNRAHDVKTGRPVGHECYVIPPALLAAERDDNWDKVRELQDKWHRSPRRFVRGRKLNGNARHLRANKPYSVYTTRETLVHHGVPTVTRAVSIARKMGKKSKVVVYDTGRHDTGHHGRFVAMFRPNAKAKRAPGWQKKLYKGAPTKFRGIPLKKYRSVGATERSHYAFPEAFKYPIHGKDVATTKRFIRTAASRYAKFKGRIAPEFREAVGRRIEAAKKKYGIGDYNPKYARKTAVKRARKVA